MTEDRKRRRWPAVAAGLLVFAAVGGISYLISRSPETTLDYVRVLIWPAVVGAALAFVFWRYRENLARLIDRIHSVRFPGGEIVAPPLQEIPAPDEDLFAEDEDEDAFADVVAYYEEQLAAQERTEEELRRALATMQGRLLLERIYFRIFGSQINLLRALRDLKPGGLARDAASAFFSAIQAQHRPVFDAWSLDDYMAFLIRERLVESNGIYRITDLGEAFLEYTRALTGYAGRPL